MSVVLGSLPRCPGRLRCPGRRHIVCRRAAFSTVPRRVGEFLPGDLIRLGVGAFGGAGKTV